MKQEKSKPIGLQSTKKQPKVFETKKTKLGRMVPFHSLKMCTSTLPFNQRVGNGSMYLPPITAQKSVENKRNFHWDIKFFSALKKDLSLYNMSIYEGIL